MTNCTKGQLEMILQICNAEQPSESISDQLPDDHQSPSKRSSNQSSKDADNHSVSGDAAKSRWTLSDVTKKLTGRSSSGKRDKYRGLCLKVCTSKMRCSIKVKEEFENVGAPIYVKTTVFEHNILSATWKSDQFEPSLSIRWNPDNATITIPLNEDADLKNISVKVSVRV